MCKVVYWALKAFVNIQNMTRKLVEAFDNSRFFLAFKQEVGEEYFNTPDFCIVKRIMASWSPAQEEIGKKLRRHPKRGDPVMPEISRFFGVVITINYADHNPPHFHAEYQGFEAVYNINTGEKIAGTLPVTLNKTILKWSKQHKKELLLNWSLARENKPLNKIQGAE